MIKLLLLKFECVVSHGIIVNYFDKKRKKKDFQVVANVYFSVQDFNHSFLPIQIVLMN